MSILTKISSVTTDVTFRTATKDDVPAIVVVTHFTLTMRGREFGARISIFNTANPGVIVVPGSGSTPNRLAS